MASTSERAATLSSGRYGFLDVMIALVLARLDSGLKGKRGVARHKH
jgi:hypothetical protein